MRTFNTAGQALLDRAIAGEAIPFVPLLEIGFEVTQRFALCGLPLVWGGYTWEPLDISVGEVDDSATQRNGLQFSFPGVSSSQLALALGEDVEGADCRLYVALVDPDTGAVGDAVPAWSGALDVPGWQEGAQALVNFTAEHRQELAARPKPSRYTNDEQQRLFPGDTALDFDPATDAAPVVWPAASYFKVSA